MATIQSPSIRNFLTIRATPTLEEVNPKGINSLPNLRRRIKRK